jgi:beta-glucosidase
MNRRELLKNLSLAGAGIFISPYLLKAAGFYQNFSRESFGKDFVWGVATAAYQIEGACDLYGKGPSVWDKFSNTKGKIQTGETGNIACDFYHQYESDLELLNSMNFKDFRFSISWPRIFPEGTGKINQQGVDFYHRLIDKCHQLGITPWITLYHWDLPQALEDKKGWVNRDIIDWFSEYVNFCTKEYGPKVKHWMILNEPVAFTALGYLVGMHAPGKKGLGKFLPAVHHAALCQAEGGRIVRANVADAQVGTTFSCSHLDPYKQKPKHIKAAKRIDAILNRLFIEPSLGLGYPVDAIPALKRIKKYYKPGDEEKLKFEFDFIGIQNYTREIIKYSLFPPIIWAKQVPAQKRNVEITEMNWEVYPEGIYNLLKKFSSYKGVDKIYISENGAAFKDEVIDNEFVHDFQRTDYIKSYLKQVLDAKNDGVNVKGYFYWTFLDNFEWAEGFRPRFGLVHVDFNTQQRIIKDSGHWFKDFLK